MAHIKEVERKLKLLPIGEYKLIDIVKMIVEADQLQKEGLFEKSPFGRVVNTPYNDTFFKEDIIKELKSYFPNGLEDLWVDLTYQRVLKLKKIIEHLRRKDMNNIQRLYFNKMLAGAIDIAIRPNGRGYVWDGFRRAIIALLCGVRFIKNSIEEHEETISEADCKAIESFVFKIKNGLSESMPKEELYKSGIVHKEEESMKLYKVIVDMGVDVLGTNPGHPELGAFSEFQDTVLRGKLSNNDYLVQFSRKQQVAWKQDSLTGYLTCGGARLLDVLEQVDEDGNKLCRSIYFHTEHPNKRGTCEIEKALVAYAGRTVDEDGTVTYAHNQVDLCANRLAGKSVESVAYHIGNKVLGLNKAQLFELATALGFDVESSDTLNYLTINDSKKAIAA